MARIFDGMKRVRPVLAGIAILYLMPAAFAQAPNTPVPSPPPPGAAAPPAGGPPPGAPPAGATKEAGCRADARSKGLRGPDLGDQVAICIADARLDCLKQAVDQKVRGPARQDFIKRCMGH